MSTYRVAEGTQVTVGGVTYTDTDTVELDDETAARFLPQGWIERVSPAPAAKARAPRKAPTASKR